MKEKLNELIKNYEKQLSELHLDLKDPDYAENQCCIESAIYHVETVIHDLKRLQNTDL